MLVLSSVSTLELLVIYASVICAPHQSNLPIYADFGKFIVCSDQECMIYIIFTINTFLTKCGCVGVHESNEFLVHHGFDNFNNINCPWQFYTLDWINVAGLLWIEFGVLESGSVSGWNLDSTEKKIIKLPEDSSWVSFLCLLCRSLNTGSQM